MMAETRIHPETGKTLRRGVRRQVVRYGSLAREVEVPGWYPEDDGDGVHTGADLAESDRVYRELREQYAARVRELRKRLRLSQEEAGRIIGGGKRAFQKYESGATPPSDAAVGLIELLSRHPKEVETLKDLRGWAMTRCIFCEAVLTADTKPEHILLNALGGRKTTRGAICSAHNNRFGATIDKAITDQVAAFRNLLQLNSGTGKAAPALHTKNEDGERLVLRSNNKPELVQKPFTVTPHHEGGFDLQINARNEAEVARIVPHVASMTGTSVESIWAQLAHKGGGTRITRLPGRVHQQLSLGGEDSLRSICKAALCLLATSTGTRPLRDQPFEEVRRFVLSGGEMFNRERGTLDPRRLPIADALEDRFGPLFNLIYIRSDRRGRVVAHFTLYNLIAWQAILSEADGPANLTVALVSNPLEPSQWSDVIAAELDVPFGWLNAPDDTDVLAATQARMNKALEVWQERNRANFLADVVNRVFKRNGIADDTGAVMDRELLARISGEIADEFAHHLAGIPHKRPMTSHDVHRLRTSGAPNDPGEV
jgi:putative zinc finger/helix-turn-helix YgiT family protein